MKGKRKIQFDTGQHQTQIQNYMAVTMPGTKLEKIKVFNLDDTEQEIILQLDYTAGSVFKEVGKRLIGNLPAVWERSYISIQHLKERQTPFKIDYPLTFNEYHRFEQAMNSAIETLESGIVLLK